MSVSGPHDGPTDNMGAGCHQGPGQTIFTVLPHLICITGASSPRDNIAWHSLAPGGESWMELLINTTGVQRPSAPAGRGQCNYGSSRLDLF